MNSQKRQVQIGVIGCGYWGKNHVRNFRELGVLAAVCDSTPEGRALATQLAPEIPVFGTYDELFAESELDGVVVATPAETHYDVAHSALRTQHDVLVEKPLALRLEHAETLVHLASENGRILMVGHVLEYHPAVARLRDLVQSGELGTLRYIYSNRLNLGKIRREENILWSFAPHDIAIILSLVGDLPYEVVATGGAYVQANIPDVTVTQLLFDNGVRAHIFVSWLHPFKEQRLVVVGSDKMAVFDDVAKQLHLFDQRVKWENGQPLPVANGIRSEPYSSEEPLRLECAAFVQAISSRQQPKTDGQSALGVLEVLTGAQRSLMTQGQPVQLQVPTPRTYRVSL